MDKYKTNAIEYTAYIQINILTYVNVRDLTIKYIQALT